jgi:glycosyltransferase involved in cell wall biosynthesis
MYWFSQTIGPHRGLEFAVTAAGLAGCPLRLTVRGAVKPAYIDTLQAIARRDAPALEIVFESPAAPDQMVDLAAMHDVGLSLEDAGIPHRALCAPNKLFVNLAAGLAVIGTATRGQAAVLASAGAGAVALPAGDAATFAAVLRRWHADRPLLVVARRAAAAAARERWRFSHANEGAALVTALQQMAT